PAAMKPYTHPKLRDVTLPMVMQALSDPCRIEIVRTLMDAGELACGDIPLTVSKATVSHHFSVLREAGLVLTRTEGTRCMTSVRRAELDKRFPGLLDLLVREKPKRLARKAAEKRA
ncbi:MAG: metalloregulator ArsR/SmtB family transcription factor, partial [Phycisphaeraceae bacterium]